MIDMATIFFSTLMCLFVVFRAIKLDGQAPWFGKRPGDAPKQDGTGEPAAWGRDAP